MDELVRIQPLIGDQLWSLYRSDFDPKQYCEVRIMDDPGDVGILRNANGDVVGLSVYKVS